MTAKACLEWKGDHAYCPYCGPANDYEDDMVVIERAPEPVWCIDGYVNGNAWHVSCDDTLIAVFDARTEAATFLADVLA